MRPRARVEAGGEGGGVQGPQAAQDKNIDQDGVVTVGIRHFWQALQAVQDVQILTLTSVVMQARKLSRAPRGLHHHA